MDLPEYVLQGESGSRREIVSEAVLCSSEDEFVCLGRKEVSSRRWI